MDDNTRDNQRFIDTAQERGEDTFLYMDPKSGECLLVSGSAAGIQLLGEIVDDYEMLCAVVESIDTDLLERWRRESQMPEHAKNEGENEHAR